MTSQIQRFAVLLGANVLIVAVYFIWNRVRKREKLIGYGSKAFVMLLCPVVGPLFIGLGYVLHRCFFYREVDLDAIIFKKDRVKTYQHADEERGRTMVSMEEALTVTDKDNLRTLMLNIVRGDIQNSLAAISLALDSEDSETSHYAASVLQDALNDFRTTVQKCRNEIEKQGGPVSLRQEFLRATSALYSRRLREKVRFGRI